MYLIAILVLCILIFVHELGHFLLAKWNKVGVLAFSIGFGPILWKKQVGETTYSLRLFPLGGFVRMAGDDPRALDPNFKPDVEEEKPGFESLKPEEFTEEQRRVLNDRSRWFLTKGFWPKFSIVFAGPAFNLIFAVILASVVVYFYGFNTPVDKAYIGEVIPNLPAERAGIKPNDLVLSIDGQSIATWVELAERVRGSGGKELLLEIERAEPGESGSTQRITLPVVAVADRSGLVSDEEREKGDVYRIGISPLMSRTPAGLWEAIKSGPVIVWSMSAQTVIGIKGLVLGHISADNIAGPIGIFKEAGRSAEKGFDKLLLFMIILSVSLAILNLLPIPVLDGGHILFFIIEAIIGASISIRVREIANQVGFALLLALMIFAISNDILR